VRSRTRALLIDAALALFRDERMRVPAIHEIAARAGVATGTFYNYFRSREELLEAAIVERAERLQDEIVESYARVADPAERVSIGSRRFILQARNEPTWAAGLLRVWSSTPDLLTRMLGPVFASLRAGRRSGRFTYSREDAAADLLVGPVAAAMLRVIDDRVDERHDTAVASLILRGIGISAGEADAIVRRPLPAVSDLEPAEDGTTGRSPRRRT
jgi:AcrR family transcriptional regulator